MSGGAEHAAAAAATMPALADGRDGGDDVRYRVQGELIDRLLGQLQATAPAQTWRNVEEVVQRIVGLYGQGLGRLLAHARAAGASAHRLATEIEGDELLASLLLLHDLHPLSAAQRVARALEMLRARTAMHGVHIELIAFEGDSARVRVRGGAAWARSEALQAAVTRVVKDAAPEIASVRLEHEDQGDRRVASGADLVQIGVRGRHKVRP